MTRTCAVRAHVRRKPRVPDAYMMMHHWMRVEVAMNEWATSFPSDCIGSMSQAEQFDDRRPVEGQRGAALPAANHEVV